jgi:dynein heavy chain
VEEYLEIQWDALNYLVSETNYGGRVSDGQDEKLLKVLLLDYYNNDSLKGKH